MTNIAPTINMTGGVKSGAYYALRIAASETALPTGQNYLVWAGAGASGTTQKFSVSNGGKGYFAGNLGVNTTIFGTNAAGVFAIAGSTAPSTSITDGIQLWAEDVVGSHELRVMDEAGNITTLSPHNFSLIPEGRSEDLAWGFYSQRGGLAINADMTKALRLVEKMSGEQLIYIKDLATGQEITPTFTQPVVDPAATQTLLAKGSIPDVAKWSSNVWHFLGELVVDGVARFKNTVTFEKLVEFAGEVDFQQRIQFADQDMAGTILMKKGDTVATVTFVKPFTKVLAVTLTAQGAFVLSRVNTVSTTGFEVESSQAQSKDIVITWIALPVQNMKETVSSSAQVIEATPTPIQAPTQSPSPLPSASLVVSPQPTPSASPSASPTVTPAPTESPAASPVI